MATVPNVSAGELIQSSWGNTVANELNGNVVKKSTATTQAVAGAFQSASLTVTPGGVNVASTITAGSTISTPGSVNAGGAVTATGAVSAGSSSPDPGTAAAGVLARSDGAIVSVLIGGTVPANLGLTRSGSPAGDVGQAFVHFRRTSANTLIGSITISGTGTTVAFNTSSDRRAKHDDGPIVDAARRVARLARRAFRGRWRPLGDDGVPGDPPADTTIWDLLSSQDIEDVAPYAVTGERDAVDDDGNPIFQQADYSKLVPLLVAAFGEHESRLDALEHSGGAR
jgi:hypothetical protein